jgi:phytoene synthase
MSEVQESVRSLDRDRYLASLFAADGKRPHLLALYAFNADVVRIRDRVSEPAIGMIRLQWWRDTVESLYDGGAGGGHPVAEALSAAIAAGGLPKQALLDLITAHEFDLYQDRMPGLTELEAYLGETSSRLIQMSAMILDREAAAKASDAAGLGGVAQGLAHILSHPHHRDPFLPEGMDVKAAISHAEKRLAEAMALIPQLPKSILPAFLPLSLVAADLKSIARAPGAPRLASPLKRQFSLWWTARKWG